jgi:transmembrane protein
MTNDVSQMAGLCSTCIALRILLTVFFWWTGLAAISNFPLAIEEVRALSLPYPAFTAASVIGLKLAASAVIIVNPPNWGWIAALALAVFTLATIPMRYSFWRLSGSRRTAEFHIVLEHLSVVGGLLIAPMVGSG